jgi:hypothetical protein
MGHIRLKQLPATLKWRQVVSLLAIGASVGDVARASAEAAEDALTHARRDPSLAHSYWLLTQIPLAARAPDFAAAAAAVGVKIGADPSLMELVGAFSRAIDDAKARRSGCTDFGEMALSAATESLATSVAADLPGLFGPNPGDVRLALGKFAAPDRFARLARDFFARLTQRHLDYYLSRTLSNHVGPGQRLPTIADHSAFNVALEQHCREASRIVETFAGGWFSKTQYAGGITPEKARDFVFVALGKISAELRRREQDGA